MTAAIIWEAALNVFKLRGESGAEYGEWDQYSIKEPASLGKMGTGKREQKCDEGYHDQKKPVFHGAILFFQLFAFQSILSIEH